MLTDVKVKGSAGKNMTEIRGQVFTKKQIYDHVTEFNEKDDLHTEEFTIFKIRKKLEQVTGRLDFIVTIRGRGYKFRE